MYDALAILQMNACILCIIETFFLVYKFFDFVVESNPVIRNNAEIINSSARFYFPLESTKEE